MDEILVFPCNIETNEVLSTIISLVSVGTFQRFYFLKRHFSGIIITFVDDFTLNSNNNKEF
jgi:hypothetical protein